LSGGTLHSTYDLLLQHDVVIAGELGVREVGAGQRGRAATPEPCDVGKNPMDIDGEELP